MDRLTLILESEEQMAREVVLGVTVERPVSLWQILIPGMFIINFLRRQTAVRQYTQTFMLPRSVALEKASAGKSGEQGTTMRAAIAERVRRRLTSRDPYPDELVAPLAVLVELLVEHYEALLSTGGDSYRLMMKKSYPRREDLQNFFDRLATAESDVDRVKEGLHPGNPRMRETLAAQRQQLAKRRSKMLDELF
jgi:hypothetical protein